LSHFRDGPGAVILGGRVNSLGAARSLAEHGVRVCVLGAVSCVARFSRSVSRFARWPPGIKAEDVADHLVKMAEKLRVRGWVLFPSSDTLLRIMAQHHSLLAEHYVLTTPPWETVKFLYDKRLTYSLAREAGVAVPRSYEPGDAGRLAVPDIDFPVVLKPAITPRFVKTSRRKAYRADNRQQLQEIYQTMSHAVGPSEVIVQQFLPDPSKNLFSYAGYFKEGEPIVGLSTKRTRQFPRDFGLHSTFVEVVDVPELGQMASQLLRAIRYTGLAEVEFMWDAKQANFKLLEVNGRLWGWHSLTIAAGLDLPYVAFADALGQKPTLGTVRSGTKWVRLLTDVQAAAQDIRAGSLGVRDYLTSLRGTTAFAVLSVSDPVPFIAEPFLTLLRRLKKLASTFRRLWTCPEQH